MQITHRWLHFVTRLTLFGLAMIYIVVNIGRAGAVSLAQGYHSSEKLAAGTVVSLSQTGSNQIQPTTITDESLLLGIAVDSINTIVDLQPKGSDVRVAISGEVPVLVSDINGNIKTGDNLVISKIAGVAMKDTTDALGKKYIAVASEGFDSKSPTSKQVTIKEVDQDRTVSVGLVKAKILLSNRQPSKVNPFLAFVENLIGRAVSTPQLVGSMVVFATTLVFTGILLNSSIRGAFIAIGRNPLSKSAIISNMIRTSLLALVILIVGIAMSYVILLV